jgi:hypothetical protein
MIVDAGRGEVGVAEPFLDLGDVGLMVERIGSGRRPQRVGANLEPATDVKFRVGCLALIISVSVAPSRCAGKLY